MTTTTKKSSGGGAAKEANRLIEDGEPAAMAAHADNLVSGGRTAATQSARVISELAVKKPEILAAYVDRFVTGLRSENKRVVQASAEALPAVAQVAPARVAKHLDRLKEGFEDLSDVAQDGIVRTFANLCAASVAYQKRLEPVLKQALSLANGKMLVTWTKTVLPALKGEPHANAREVVAGRLGTIEKAHARAIAEILGVKLRSRSRSRPR